MKKARGLKLALRAQAPFENPCDLAQNGAAVKNATRSRESYFPRYGGGSSPSRLK